MMIKELIKVHERALNSFEKEREKILKEYENKEIPKYKKVMLGQQLQNYDKLIVRENNLINRLISELS